MDSLTHALIITIIFVLIGRPDLALYGILGAVLIDVDVLFSFFSNRDPKLYIFTHGGITHSFLGAFIIALLAVVPAVLLSSLGAFNSFTQPFSPVAFMAILAGAISHITVDYLAYPGIPLFYPLSDRKYTLGIMGGPSAFIMLASVAYLAAMAVGLASIYDPWPYIAFFGLMMTLGAGTKTYASIKTRAWTIATMNPLKWLVIEDTPDAYLFYKYDLLGHRSSAESYEKYNGITRSEAEKNDGRPEVRRMKYHSYIVAVEKNGDGITYRDPIREKGHIWYPPYFKSYSIKE